MGTMRSGLARSAAVGLMALLAACPAHAQDPEGQVEAPDPAPVPEPVSEPVPGPEDPYDDADDSIVVIAPTQASEDTHAVDTVTQEDLERAAGQDLGEALSQVPGVTAARGSSDATKPIIRGQYERRLLLLVDGVRHESQKWGLEHAPEIDPFAAGQISVVKGAAGVHYGPDAIGGVVLVEPPPLRTEPGIGGRAQLVGVSNGMRGVAALRLDGAHERLPGFSWRVEANESRGGALSTPDYVLGNTGSEEWNAGATVGWQKDVVSLKAAYRHYDYRSGVCYCVKNSTPDDFLGQLEDEEPVGADLWTPGYTIDRPYQAVTHDLALLRAVVGLRGGVLKATYAYQDNDREEFDQVRSSVTGPQYDFTLRTHTLDVFVGHDAKSVGAVGSLEGGAGVSGTFQENVYSGLPLIPNFRSFQGGVHGFERWTKGDVAVEVGGRFDHLSRAAYLTESAHERALARGTLQEEDCEITPTAARCPASYDAASASLGGLWHAIPDRLEARLDLSSASRFPNADELYMNGSAPTFPVYGLGSPDLGVETTWGASPTLGLRLDWMEAEASTYANLIDDFVYFAPELGPDGEPAFDVTIQGAFPRYSYRPIDALFYGFDGGVTFGGQSPLQVGLQGSIVRASNADTQERLVMIPSDRVEATVGYARERLGPLREAFAEVSGLQVFRQTRVDERADFAPPPDGYFLLGASLGAELPLGERALQVGLSANNLLNARYRDYTSLLRYFADEPGREIRLRVALDF